MKTLSFGLMFFCLIAFATLEKVTLADAKELRIAIVFRRGETGALFNDCPKEEILTMEAVPSQISAGLVVQKENLR